MNKKRLLKMADFVETIPRKQFDMRCYMNDCGTVGCALGWAAEKKIFRGLRVDRDGGIYVKYGEEMFLEAAMALFGIDWAASSHLFLRSTRHHTPKQVARNIRKFVKSDGAVLP